MRTRLGLCLFSVPLIAAMMVTPEARATGNTPAPPPGPPIYRFPQTSAGGIAAWGGDVTPAQNNYSSAPEVNQITTMGGSVWGIIVDTPRNKADNAINSIILKLDGEATPVKYVVPAHPDPNLAADLKAIFSVMRVHLIYIENGDIHQLVSVKRDLSHPQGTVTGEVRSVNGDGFWVEVQPKIGFPDGYACGGNWKDMQARLKTLKKGDTVTITFHSDSERKRIDSLTVVSRGSGAD